MTIANQDTAPYSGLLPPGTDNPDEIGKTAIEAVIDPKYHRQIGGRITGHLIRTVACFLPVALVGVERDRDDAARKVADALMKAPGLKRYIRSDLMVGFTSNYGGLLVSNAGPAAAKAVVESKPAPRPSVPMRTLDQVVDPYSVEGVFRS